jgi:catechol 2,3-dioxygenase-like lactoylglutathione lyase family enzyme
MTDMPFQRGLDHLVLPSSNIEDQTAFYRRLGFQIGARNKHPWGTENHIVQFDGSFLELITCQKGETPPPHALRQFSFGSHVANWLEQSGDGMSMLVLDSLDAKADARSFQQNGIGDFEPFDFDRKAKRPDGSETQVAFTLSFAQAEVMPALSFFVCQQHYPENFWNASMQRHPNGVTGIKRVIITHDQPQDCVDFLTQFSGGKLLEESTGFSIATKRGMISILKPQDFNAHFADEPVSSVAGQGRFAAIVFDVEDLEATAMLLRADQVPFELKDKRIIISSKQAIGITIIFEQRQNS